jgi:hypothetical protein
VLYGAFGFGGNVVHLKQKYIIANDNHLGGFGPHKDKKAVWKNIQFLQRRLAIYRKIMDELNEFENLEALPETERAKTVEEQAIDEVFDYFIRKK